MAETITVMERSELTVSQASKKTYFTIVDQQDRKLICFKPNLYDNLVLGNVVQLDIRPGKTESDTPRIEGLLGEKETEVKQEPKTWGGKSYGKSPEELESSKQTMVLSYAKDLKIAGFAAKDMLDVIEMYHSLFSALGATQLAKPRAEGKQEKPASSVEAQEKAVGQEDSTGGVTPVQEFMTWVQSHGKRFTSSWVCETLSTPEKRIKAPTEITDFASAKKDVMALAGWES